MEKHESFIIIGIILAFAVAFYSYPHMPEKMASHWNINGEADGYMQKFWGLFLIPFVLVGAGILLAIIPRIDPLKKNLQESIRYYGWFVVAFFAFMLFIFAQVILWNLGIHVSFNRTIPIGIGVLFFFIGSVMKKVKRNWFIGIRTPWTLSSDNVWKKTHEKTGKLFQIAGLMSLAGIFFRQYSFYFAIFPIIAVSIWSIFYSYLVYRKEPK